MKTGMIFIISALVLCLGCEGVLGLDGYSKGEEITVDTETDEDGDYWFDGYCPLAGDSWVKVSEDCNGITSAGCCDESGRMLYCQGLDLYCFPCSAQYTGCGLGDDGNLGCVGDYGEVLDTENIAPACVDIQD
jgi:hypothetical protein